MKPVSWPPRQAWYVLHVKQGYEDREKSVIAQFAGLGQPFEWILAYDVPDLNQEVLARYACAPGTLRETEISCCLKHIRAWEKIVDDGWAGGFVFEDDALLDQARFRRVVPSALAEFGMISPASDARGYLSLGDGCALHVPWTKRRRGQYLYAAEHVRATDSYWINRETALLFLQWIREHGVFLPADYLINRITADCSIPILWLEPTVVSQGSHTGRFPSIIQEEDRGGVWAGLIWRIKKLRRKYLYPLLGVDLRIFKRHK